MAKKVLEGKFSLEEGVQGNRGEKIRGIKRDISYQGDSVSKS